jgi:CDP-diacylglycerol--serine O-phosphatidyltransferase
MSAMEILNGEAEGSNGPMKRFRRGIYLLPSALTVANLLCGYFAILATLKGSAVDLDHAARAIGFAILFDMLDGRVARATGTNSEFGKEFDSLADIVSFGVAPAFLSFAWGVRGTLAGGSRHAHLAYQLGWLVTFVFVICCAWRLARYNVHGAAPAGSSRYFVGLPTPAGAAGIAAVVHGFWSPIQDWRVSLLWLLVVLLLALLMVSTVRYSSFKEVRWKRRQPSVMIVLVAVLLAGTFFYSEIVFLLLAGIYVMHGPILQLWRSVRHGQAGGPAARPI